MYTAVPGNAGQLIERGDEFRARLQGLKQRLTVPDYGWYPYNSLATLEVITRLLEPVFGAVLPARSGPIADIGCGDGDLGLFWAHLGATVDAVDHAESNFNQMRGVTILRDALGLPMEIHDLDLDREFSLPRSEYHLAFFLGTLYHLKNPGLALKILARQCDWCILSTRIAQVTPRGVEIEEEPLAYLLGAREANNDPTNYWIFSATGLFRLLDRAGWIVVGHERLGQTRESDPVKPEADERIFVLVKSKLRHPELVFHPLYGWFEPEQDAWRWTAKRFGLEVIPPENPFPTEFALRMEIPAPLFRSDDPVRVTCTIDNRPAGTLTCTKPESIEFRGRFPHLSGRASVRLDFEVHSAYAPSGGDVRDLGVIIPAIDQSPGSRAQIPFRVS